MKMIFFVPFWLTTFTSLASPWFKAWTARCEAQTLPLCYPVPPKRSSLLSCHIAKLASNLLLVSFLFSTAIGLCLDQFLSTSFKFSGRSSCALDRALKKWPSRSVEWPSMYSFDSFGILEFDSSPFHSEQILIHIYNFFWVFWIAQRLHYCFSPSSHRFDSMHSQKTYFDVAENCRWRWLEKTEQRLDFVDWTHLNVVGYFN